MGQMARRVAALVGGAAVVDDGVLHRLVRQGRAKGAGDVDDNDHDDDLRRHVGAAEVAPTEKSINPSRARNLFSPTVNAPPAPTAIPGDN